MRINVTGNAGTGKTTLSRTLARTFDLALIEMDRVVWDPGWREVDKDERVRRLDPQLEVDHWIVDGVSRKAREMADIVVFIDAPTAICIRRCLVRAWSHGFANRAELPANCPEWKIMPKLMRIILDFPRLARPRILEDIRTRNCGDLVIDADYDLNKIIEYLKDG